MSQSQHLRATRLPLAELPSLLPTAIRHLSNARAQIVVDQIRATLDRGSTEQLFAIVVTEKTTSKPADIAAVSVALDQPGTDTATLLLAALTEKFERAAADQKETIMRLLADRTDRVLREAGTRFLQWATDPVAPPASTAADHSIPPFNPNCQSGASSQAKLGRGDESVRTPWWAEQLGMQALGTLEYQTLELSPSSPTLTSPLPGSAPAADLVPLNWDADSQLERLTRVVEQTYGGTLDCPELSRFRSARQIIAGYREADTFDPRGWYLLRGSDRSIGESDRGVLILARHRTAGADGVGESFVAELVYMGLVPEARGHGLAGTLVAEAVRRSAAAGARRLILAVDEKNEPARKRYREFGFRPMMRETVFAKSLHTTSVTGGPVNV